MSLNPAQWHTRFSAQARWTQSLRSYIYKSAGLRQARRVLDLGCGTGALTSELTQLSQAFIYGLDLNLINLGYAQSVNPNGSFLCGDALEIPFRSDVFDLTLCHFVLLWVRNPTRVLSEMRRVTRPGGAVIALAEPDYGGRLDYPPELAVLGEWQQASLRKQGAEPYIGRQLSHLFHEAGLESVETGVLGNQWKGDISQAEIESEWSIIQADLEALFSHEQLDTMIDEIRSLHQIDLAACQRGERLLFVPTFYAWGRAP